MKAVRGEQPRNFYKLRRAARLYVHVVRAPFKAAADRARQAFEKFESTPKPRTPSKDTCAELDRYVKAQDGAEVRYRFRQAKNSNPNTKTLALMCGFDTHPAVYLGQISVFNKECSVLTMENRGHWKSSRGKSTPKTYIDDLAKDLKAALDKEGVGKIVIVAHSMWGAAALRFYELFPEKVEAIVFAASAFTDPRELWIYGNPAWMKLFSEAVFSWLHYNPFIDVVRRGLEKSPFAWETMKYIVFGTILEDAKIPEHALKLIKNVWRANTRSLAIAMKAMFNLPKNWEERCAQINVPVLVIAGKRDPLIRWKKLESFASAFPHASFVLEEGSMHFPMLSNPENFNNLVLTFVGELRGGQ